MDEQVESVLGEEAGKREVFEPFRVEAGVQWEE